VTTIPNDALTLPQFDVRIWPALARGTIRGNREQVIVDIGEMFDDIATITVAHIDSVSELLAALHASTPSRANVQNDDNRRTR
jgi:hypothetical protein